MCYFHGVLKCQNFDWIWVYTFTTESILLHLLSYWCHKVLKKYIGKPHSKMLIKRRFVPKKIVAYYLECFRIWLLSPKKTCIYTKFNFLLTTVNHPASVMELFGTIHSFLYKQLGLGHRPQRCLYFRRFWGSKLLNGCLVVWPSTLCLQGMY